MKRINILLSKQGVVGCLLTILMCSVGIPLFFQWFCTMLGDATMGMFLIFSCIFTPIGLIGLYADIHRLPLYLEYDETKIIVHYPFRKPTILRKDVPIYRAYCFKPKHEFLIVLSNTPFRVREHSPRKWVASHIDYSTQLILPERFFIEHPAVCKRSACIPAERIDWDILLDQHEEEKATYADSERIFILPGYLWALLSIELGAIAFLAYLIFIFSEGFVYAFIMLLYSSVLWAYGIYEAVKAYKNRRFCGTVSFTESTVISKLFKKEQCTVDLSHPIHYAVFRGAEYASKNKPYIVISNQWFNYYPIIDDDRSYLSVYDSATQIVFPYNEETAPICDFDNWHCVGGFGELNMKRSKTP